MSERGTYRSIACALLAGKDFRQLPERARWIFVVLKMNIGAVGIDTWYPEELLARLSSESGATPSEVEQSLTALEEKGWIEREDNIVWVKKHLTHDPHLSHENPKHRKSVQRHVAGLPRNAIVMRFCSENQDWIPKGEAKAMGLAWVYEPMPEAMGIKSRSTNRKPNTEEDASVVRSELLKAFPADAHRTEVVRFLTLIPEANQRSWTATIRGWLGGAAGIGVAGSKSALPEDVARGLSEWLAAAEGAKPTPVHVRSFVERAMRSRIKASSRVEITGTVQQRAERLYDVLPRHGFTQTGTFDAHYARAEQLAERGVITDLPQFKRELDVLLPLTWLRDSKEFDREKSIARIAAAIAPLQRPEAA